jgi:hypothetical protein
MSKAKFLVGYLPHFVIVTAVRRPAPDGCLVLQEGDEVELSPEEVEAVQAVLPKGCLMGAKAPAVEDKEPPKGEDKGTEDPFSLPPEAPVAEGKKHHKR